MACAATRPTFSFHLSTSFPQSSPPKPRPHFTQTLNPSQAHSHRLIAAHSIDISKEDTPTPTPTASHVATSTMKRWETRRIRFRRDCSSISCQRIGDARLVGRRRASLRKAVLIYGSLLVFFVLFLSGYWLQ
ncbi:hypothetical protein SLA2020_303280 [Shorea laevis]